jgi:hypothetical protein
MQNKRQPIASPNCLVVGFDMKTGILYDFESLGAGAKKSRWRSDNLKSSDEKLQRLLLQESLEVIS